MDRLNGSERRYRACRWQTALLALVLGFGVWLPGYVRRLLKTLLLPLGADFVGDIAAFSIPLAALFLTNNLAQKHVAMQREASAAAAAASRRRSGGGDRRLRRRVQPLFHGDNEEHLPLTSLAHLWRTEKEPVQKPQNPVIVERIKQLGERTRICSRQVWEEKYLPQLRGTSAANHMKPALTQCCVCMSDIGMQDQVRGLSCGHIYHLHCVAEWFMRDPTLELSCPLCRVPMSEQRCFEELSAECQHPEHQEHATPLPVA